VDSLSGPQTQTFTYDNLDRLTNSAVTGGSNGLYTEGYTYDGTTGNLASKNGVTYTYNATHKHAVASAGSNTYGYDANGNMTSRNVSGQSFTLSYDAENRLVSVTGAATATFVYDGDSKQIKSIVNGVTTYYVGNHYEVKSGVVTKYYFAGTTRLAVRTGGTLSFLLSDHLGSSSVTTDANGAKTATALYKAFGETRYTLGNLGSDYKFTGQRLQAELGIYWFQSRWMDPSLGRFTQPDTIVPTSTQGTQAWDRYAYTSNNPLRYTDPTGHRNCEEDGYNCEGDKGTETDGNNDSGSVPACRLEFSEAQCQAISSAIGIGVLVSDSTALSLSAVGVILETVGFLTGGPEGFVAAIGAYQPYNSAENTLAWASVGASAVNDFLVTGESYGTLDANWRGIPSAEFVLGSDTTIGFASAVAGLSPEGFTDAGINSLVVAYDGYRLSGGEPLIQTHIGITITLHPYITFNKP